ncbi:MAG: hypothetical protein OXI10_11455 [Gammaproteobacteria bacterium]|nr:hypothetical protein [Gammaproteobacteria bacterium]
MPTLKEHTKLRRPNDFFAPVMNGVSKTAAPCRHADFDVTAGRQQTFAFKLLCAACRCRPKSRNQRCGSKSVSHYNL